MKPMLDIEIYSDLICPWCYIGKRRMEVGLKSLRPEPIAKITWKPFQLNPDMPIGGKDRRAYRSQKFGSWEMSQSMDDEVAATGRTVGLEFNYDKVLRTPNTLAGHRLLWWARGKGDQDALSEALFRGYFTEGRDVGEHDVLAQIAGEAGFPESEAHAFLKSSSGAQEVAAEELRGHKLGLRGVPFFVVNGVPAFSGAQSAETFLGIFQEAIGTPQGQCEGGSCSAA